MKILSLFTLLAFIATTVFLIIFSASSTSSFVSATEGFSNCSRSFIHGYIPGEPSSSTEICRDGVLAISYSGNRRNANWVAYYVTSQDVHDNIPGRDSFYEDPDLEKMGVPQASVDAEVWSSEWNRGHLAPSRLLSWSEDSKYSTYTMANVNPQYGYFNQHPWQYLETDIFNWIGDHEALYLVTGVGYDDIDHPTSVDGVAVPDYYWKAFCNPETKQSAAVFGYNKKMDVEKIKELGTGEYMSEMMSVTELSMKISKMGMIFPTYYCNPDKFDKSYWGFDPNKSFKEAMKRGEIVEKPPKLLRQLKK